jgi:mannosyltransferase
LPNPPPGGRAVAAATAGDRVLNPPGSSSEHQLPVSGGAMISAAHLVLIAGTAVVLAIAARLPHLSESLWLDELHSAWTIWDGLGDVARRAALGNQTPVFYWGLWLWRQAFGDSEFGLRISSVILSSLACGVVAAGVAQQSRSRIAGLSAGMLLATDPHSIVFGTELRVFAAVMCLAAVACWSWIAYRRTANARLAVLMITAVLVAAMIQPMSLGVLGWLCISALNVRWVAQPLWNRSSEERWVNRSVLWIAILSTALLLFWWLAGNVLVNAWQHRGQWALFAAAHSPWQIWTMWRWNLLLIPAGFAIGFAFVERLAIADPVGEECAHDRATTAWLAPAVVVVWVAIFYWLISAIGIAPIFHRRYLIAALPILVWAGAGAIGEVCWRLSQLVATTRFAHAHRVEIRWLQGTLPLLMMCLITGGAAWWLRLPLPLQLRGEDWRGAVAHLADTIDSQTPILLSPGLIETTRFLSSNDRAKIDYLAFPLRGPYQWPRVTVVDIVAAPGAAEQQIAQGKTQIVLLRGPRKLAIQWAERAAILLAAQSMTYEVRSFGGVQLVRFSSP